VCWRTWWCAGTGGVMERLVASCLTCFIIKASFVAWSASMKVRLVLGL
jgi:hypothetical protein